MERRMFRYPVSMVSIVSIRTTLSIRIRGFRQRESSWSLIQSSSSAVTVQMAVGYVLIAEREARLQALPILIVVIMMLITILIMMMMLVVVVVVVLVNF